MCEKVKSLFDNEMKVYLC